MLLRAISFVTRTTLIAMLLYSSYHAMMDSDGLTYENRVIEALKWAE